jgi:hypothetical protein
MAVQFLTGLDVQGNLNLNNNQIQNVIIQPLGADPSGIAGKIYYNSGTSKLRLYDGSAWVDLTTGADGNTTYDLTATGSGNGTATLNLVASNPASTDAIVYTGSGTTTVTRAGSTFTINSADQYVGTVTDVIEGKGISVTGTSTVTPTVNIDYTGADNAILTASTLAIQPDDYLWFSAKEDATIYKTTLATMPGFGKDGTVTSVGSGAGLTGGAITAAGTLAVDYAGVDNVVLAAANGTAIDLVADDKILFSDDTDSNAKYANLSQVASYINAGAGSVTSVDVSGGTTGLTTSGGPITSSGTITLAGTLNEVNGGTGLAAYTKGDILFADGANSLATLAIGGSGQRLAVSSLGVVEWVNDSGSGVTSIEITETGNALTITGGPITTSGTINIAGAGSSAQVVRGDLTLGTYTTGTVTSVATGKGLKGGTITSTGTVEVDYGTAGLIEDAPLMGQTPASDDLILIQDAASGTGVTAKQPLGKVSLSVFDKPSADLSFGNFKLTELANGTASKDGVNLGQVQALVAGVGVFQGGYDASANSPAIAGASNIALTTGDFFVVTKDGTIAFNGSTVAVEVGDTIYANQTIAASSNPPASDYAIVIQDQNIAGVGATDGATEKGVAGFSSATFAGTATGFITVKAGGISDAQLASTFNKIIGTDTDLDTDGVDVVDQINVTDGVIQSMSKRTLPNAATGSVGVTEIATQAEVDAGTDTFRYVTPATLASAQSKRSYTGTYPATTANTFSIATGVHGLANGPWIIQTYDSKGNQVFMDVLADKASGTVTFTTTSNMGANDITVVMQLVG